MKAEYIDHMGSDISVVNAARVSFDKHSFYEVDDYGAHLKDGDAKLISYLAKHNHFTPFTHCVVTLRETVPIFVARQRFKHTVGFSYNEVSRRYVNDTPEFWYPSEWRKRAENVKQGSSEEVFDINMTNLINEDYYEIVDLAVKFYDNAIEKGMAPEQARMVLPQSMFTSYYVTGSLYAWARAYLLRSDSHAQKEIQELAGQWNGIMTDLFPVSWEALTKGNNNA